MDPFFLCFTFYENTSSRNHLSQLPFISLWLGLVLGHKQMTGHQMGLDCLEFTSELGMEASSLSILSYFKK